MFNRYEVFYRDRFIGYVNALSENSARDKGAVLVEHATGIRRCASAYSGLDTRNIEVKRT